MIRLTRWFVLLALLSSVAPLPAVAIPSPADSSIPCGILFVGRTGTSADPLGTFEIVVRDLAHNGLPGAEVRIVFDDCLGNGDLRVSSAPPGSSASIVCAPGSVEVHGTTGTSGDMHAVFRASLVGGGFGANADGFSEPPDCEFHLRGCATVYADGVNMGRVSVARLDADGVNGLGPPDIAYWLADSFGTQYLARSDFDFNGVLRAPDLSILLQAIFDGGSTSSAASYCE